MLKRPSNGIRNMAYDRYYRIQAPLRCGKASIQRGSPHLSSRSPLDIASLTLLTFASTFPSPIWRYIRFWRQRESGSRSLGLGGSVGRSSRPYRCNCEKLFYINQNFGSSLRRICGIWREVRSNSTGTSWSLEGI